jgi:hypothetical protein
MAVDNRSLSYTERLFLPSSVRWCFFVSVKVTAWVSRSTENIVINVLYIITRIPSVEVMSFRGLVSGLLPMDRFYTLCESSLKFVGPFRFQSYWSMIEPSLRKVIDFYHLIKKSTDFVECFALLCSEKYCDMTPENRNNEARQTVIARQRRVETRLEFYADNVFVTKEFPWIRTSSLYKEPWRFLIQWEVSNLRQ